MEHALGVDLGTSNTVAILRWPDGRTRPLLFDGQPVMPSGVLLDDQGRLHVGRDAQRLAQADPARYEPNPKRRIDEPAVLLGDREVHTVDLLASLLAAVAHAAVEAVGHLPPAALTYPAAWGARRRELLATAVTRAGWPAVGPDGRGTKLVPEPVAAARYFSGVLRRPIPVGKALAVFDFGGGTLDVAVVRNEGTHFTVIGTGGVAELGGLDLDAALVDHLGRVIAAGDPAVWQRLLHPSGAMQLRDRRSFWDDVRGAKEMLSRAAVAPVAVPGVEQHIHLTREELERLATPLLRRGVYATAAVINECGLRTDQLAGLFLVGGSSRVPLVARLLHSELGIAPTVLEQPELPVAEGALAELVAEPAPAAVSVSAPPAGAVSAPPASGPPAAPISAPPTLQNHPVSPPATSAWPPQQPPPPQQPHLQPAFGQPEPAAGKKRTWLIAAAAAALVVVIAAVAGIVYLLKPSGYDGVEFRSFVDVGTPVPLGADETPYYTWTQLLDDRAYFAYQREDKRIEVIAAEADSGKELWRKQSQDTSEEWGGITAVPGGVVVFAKSSLSDEPYDVSVWSADDGRRLWGMPIFRDDGVLFREDRLILVDRAQNRVAGFDLLSGSLKWQEATPKDRFESRATAVYGVSTPDDLAGPADALGKPFAPKADDDQRIVQVSADKSMRVIDAANGKVGTTRTNVADQDDPAYAYDGRFVVTTDAGVFSYDLDSNAQPTQIYTPADDQHDVTVLAPCGENRVCLLETTSFDAKTTELVAVDAEKGGELWRKPAAGMERVVPVGDHLLVSGDSPDYVVSLYDAAGEVSHTQLGVGMRVNGGSVLLLSKYLTSSVGDPSVAGMDVGAKEPTQLGPLTGVRTESCSFNTAVIACAGEEAFLIRRFASA